MLFIGIEILSMINDLWTPTRVLILEAAADC